MSSGPAYDALGRILAEGGEIAVSRLLAAGASASGASAVIAERFPELSQSQRDTLLSMSQDMVEAGEVLSAGALDETMPIADIPVNPNLFADDPGGRRIRFGGEFHRTGTDKWYTLYIDLADTETIGEAMARIRAGATDVASRYPRAFGGMGGGESDIDAVRIILAERRF